jgi:hypothetical protein
VTGKRYRALGFRCRGRVFEREQDAEIFTCRRDGAIVAFVRS